LSFLVSGDFGLDGVIDFLAKTNVEEHVLKPAVGVQGFMILGVAFFAFMGWVLWRVARRD